MILTECIIVKQATYVPGHPRRPEGFWVVSHEILLRNLIFDGITRDEWLLLRNMYSDMTSCVKWKGQLSQTFHRHQGVRQGGILSRGRYKRYNNPLLLMQEEQFTGIYIGNIRIPHTTCADDVALISSSQEELTCMLNTVENFSNQYMYTINQQRPDIQS